MSFPLAGNLNIRSSLENAILAQRIPHAIMLEGDEGQGKKTLARFIAMAAVCEKCGLPCGECRGCHLAEVGSHPDISFISPEEGKKNISVAQIRELRAEAYVKAHSAEHRVFIITAADKMNEQAQNALLKVLEEPPRGVIFILITASKSAMLETIVSRCNILSLSSPPAKQGAEVLSRLSPKKSPEEIAAALEKSGNNIGGALRLLCSKKQSPASFAAGEFLRLLFSGSEFEMLKILLPFEKDRIAAEEFFMQLKCAITAELKGCCDNPVRSKVLTSLYDEITKYEQLLKTNVNLPLLFSAAVCKARMLSSGR